MPINGFLIILVLELIRIVVLAATITCLCKPGDESSINTCASFNNIQTFYCHWFCNKCNAIEVLISDSEILLSDAGNCWILLLVLFFYALRSTHLFSIIGMFSEY